MCEKCLAKINSIDPKLIQKLKDYEADLRAVMDKHGSELAHMVMDFASPVEGTAEEIAQDKVIIEDMAKAAGLTMATAYLAGYMTDHTDPATLHAFNTPHEQGLLMGWYNLGAERQRATAH